MLEPSPGKLCFVGIKLEPVHIHPGCHISNARLECMSSCRRFLRVRLEEELSVIGVGVESRIMCCNCVLRPAIYDKQTGTQDWTLWHRATDDHHGRLAIGVDDFKCSASEIRAKPLQDDAA